MPTPTPEEDPIRGFDPVEDALLRCIRRPPAQWSEAIEALCSSDPGIATELRARFAQIRRLEQLLPADDSSGGPQLTRFRMLRRLGAGGMGVVWLAEQVDLRRRVALKLVRPEYLASASIRERFAREALAAGKLDHPAICPVYEVGEDGGQPFLAMRYLEGETLAEILERRKATGLGSALSREQVDAVLRQFEQLCDGLQLAHDHRLVHRDIKPGNVMITTRGEAVLLDFGLARDLDSDAATLTATGHQLGTPAYMPPEQVRGQHRRIDHRADVYALGVTLFETLTGRRPFDDPDRERLYQQILGEPPPDPTRLCPNLPREMRPVLERALEKEPVRRYPTMAAFGEQLRRVRMRETITVKPIGPGLRAMRWTQRHPVATAVIALLAVGLVVTRMQNAVIAAESARSRANAMAYQALATLPTDPNGALQVAARAEAEHSSPVTVGMLQAAIQQQHELLRLDAPEVEQVLWSPTDEQRLASRHLIGKAFVWHLDTSPPRRIELVGHDRAGRIECISFSPDGELVATTCNDGFVRVFATADGALRWQSPALGVGEAPWWVEFRPGSAATAFTIAVAIADGGTVHHRVDVARRRVRWQLYGSDGSERSAPCDATVPGKGRVFAPRCHFLDLDTLACVAFTGATSWHLPDDATASLLEMHEPAFFDVVSANGSHLGFGGNGAFVRSAEGAQVARVSGHPKGSFVRCGAVSADGSLAVTGGEDGTAMLTRLTTGAMGPADLQTIPLAGHPDAISDAAFTPTGDHVLTASMDGLIRMFDLDGELVLRLVGHDNRARSVSVSHDGSRVLSAGMDGTIRLWSLLALGPPAQPASGDVRALAVAPDGATFAIAIRAGDRGELRVCRHDGTPVANALPLPGAPSSIGFDPGDASRVAAALGRGVAVLDLAAGRPERVVSLPKDQNDVQFAECAWSKDRTLWTLQRRNDGIEAQVRAFEREGNGAWQEAWASAPLPQCHTFDVTPDGDTVLIGCYDGNARLLAVRTGSEGAAFRHGHELSMVGFAHDATRFFTLSKVADAVVKLWACDGGEPIELIGHTKNPVAAAFSADDRQIATCGLDGSVRLWRTEDGAPLMAIPAHAGTARAVVWLPDGERLWSGGADSAVRQLLASPELLRQTARRLIVSPR